MKTSEFIREAVDKYLAANAQEYNNTGKVAGLCYPLSMIPPAYALLQDIRRDAAGSEFVPKWLIDGDITEESQAIRFMLAEFMALYFEDFGD